MSSIRHIGLVVENIEKQTLFYTSVFGLHILSQNTETGEYISNLVGIPNVIVKWVKLASNDNVVLLELLQYETHPCTSANYAPNRHGCSHIAITVSDMEESLMLLKGAGGSAGEYIYNPEGTVKVIYAYDPEGIILELVQEL